MQFKKKRKKKAVVSNPQSCLKELKNIALKNGKENFLKQPFDLQPVVFEPNIFGVGRLFKGLENQMLQLQ